MSERRPMEPPAPQRLPGRLQHLGPLSHPDALLAPMTDDDLTAWEQAPVAPEAPRP